MAHQVVLHLKGAYLVSLVDGAGGWFHFLDLVDAGSDGRDLVSGKNATFFWIYGSSFLSWLGAVIVKMESST